MIALLVMQTELNYLAIEESAKHNGIDYWIGPESKRLFEKKARLEVSGIRSGNESDINARTKEKLTRLYQYKAQLPAYIIVCEFSAPTSRVVKYEANNT